MERTYAPQTSDQNAPAENRLRPLAPPRTTLAAERLASSIGNVIAIPLALLAAVAAVLFLLVALQPILSILVALVVFPIVLPLAAFLLVVRRA